MCAVRQRRLNAARLVGCLRLSLWPPPVRIDTGERERIKDFKRAYLAMSLTAMLLVYVFLLPYHHPPTPPPPPTPPLLSHSVSLSLLLISDAASQFNGHYDQIPGRDRGGSE